MLDQFGQLVRFGLRRQRHGRPVAGLPGHHQGTLLLRPGLGHHHGAEGITQPADDRLVDIGGQVRPGEQRVAHLDVVGEAFGDAPEADLGDCRGGVAEQRQAGTAFADLGQRRSDRAGHGLAPGNGDLQRRRAGAGDIDQFGVDQQRRTGKHDDGDLRQVDRQRYDDVVRRRRTGPEHIGKGTTDFNCGIVEQYGERRFHGVGDLGIDLALEVETAERSGCAGAVAGRRAVDPIEEFAGEHGDLSPIVSHLVRK